MDFAFEDITHFIVENQEEMVILKAEMDKISSQGITEENRNHLKSVITIFGKNKMKE